MRELTKKEILECKSLEQWLSNVDGEEIDAFLEWLQDSGYLSATGIKFTLRYWQHYWHKDKVPK